MEVIDIENELNIYGECGGISESHAIDFFFHSRMLLEWEEKLLINNLDIVNREFLFPLEIFSKSLCCVRNSRGKKHENLFCGFVKRVECSMFSMLHSTYDVDEMWIYIKARVDDDDDDDLCIQKTMLLLLHEKREKWIKKEFSFIKVSSQREWSEEWGGF